MAEVFTVRIVECVCGTVDKMLTPARDELIITGLSVACTTLIKFCRLAESGKYPGKWALDRFIKICLFDTVWLDYPGRIDNLRIDLVDIIDDLCRKNIL